MQDIRSAFSDLHIREIVIDSNDGRYKAGAKIILENPEILDQWPKSRQNVFVKNKEVSVCVGNSDGWLCVAKLPLHYDDARFQELADAYGMVKTAFVMISEVTGMYADNYISHRRWINLTMLLGEGKGYGFIKYSTSEAAAQARHLLNTRSIGNYHLDCDWLNSSHISFKSLHSKALRIDGLPSGYRDREGLRKLFTVVKPPPFCQVIDIR